MYKNTKSRIHHRFSSYRFIEKFQMKKEEEREIITKYANSLENEVFVYLTKENEIYIVFCLRVDRVSPHVDCRNIQYRHWGSLTWSNGIAKKHAWIEKTIDGVLMGYHALWALKKVFYCKDSLI